MSTDAGEIPNHFVCPITQEVMQDPVIAVADGNTYERAAIVEWLKKSQTSPITRQPLASSQLVPNRALKDAIDAYRATGNNSVPSAANAAAVQPPQRRRRAAAAPVAAARATDATRSVGSR